MDISLIGQMVVNGLVLSATYIMIAIGFNMAFGIMRIVNFAHGTIYMLGAYATFVAVSMFGLNYFVAIIIAIIFTFCLGWLVERSLLRGAIRGDLLAGIILTLGLLYFFQSGALLIFGEHPKGISSPLHGIANIGGVVLPVEKLLPTAFAVILVGLLYVFLRFTRTGQSLRAVTDDNEAAALMGISINKAYALGFALGAALAGAAGALIAPIFLIEAGMGAVPLWKTFVVVLLGGMGSLTGCVLAGLLLGLVDSFVGTLVSATTASIVGFIAIILILIFRPEGFMGEKVEV